MGDINIRFESGLGDILMLCGTAKALSLQGHKVHLMTAPRFAPIAKACSYFASVDYPGSGIYTGRQYREAWNMQIAIAEEHQIDALLGKFGCIEPDPLKKSIDLRENPEGAEKIRGLLQGLPPRPKIVLHPGISDISRTYLRWQEVVDGLRAAGTQVLVIGATHKTGQGQAFADALRSAGAPIRQLCRDPKGVQKLDHVIDFTNALTPLETVELIRQCHCVVGTDSGPLHMVGATKTPLVGIYTCVRGEYRVPYRAEGKTTIIQGPCKTPGCFNLINNAEVHARFKPSGLRGNIYEEWCPEGGYGCLNVPPKVIVDAVLSNIV